MLVLSRRMGEKIRINDDITFTILETRGGAIKIGIEAPKNVTVHREEIYKRIQDNKEKKENSDE